MTTVLDSSLTAALAWALLHFLWQGTVIAGAVCLLWRLRLGPRANYVLGVVALGAMLVAPIATTAYLNGRVASGVSPFAAPAPAQVDRISNAAVEAAAMTVPREAAGTTSDALSTRLRAAAPGAMLALWIAGVVVLSIRLLGGWIVARRLVTRGASPVAPEIASLARRVAGRLALDRAVRVLESRAVAVPVMVGWLQPVVLFPVSALSGLTPTQIEALLAHELAHVRRHDYVVNLLQSVVETLLFYHPAVWWVSRRVRAEREHCCDDLALSVSDRITYATALTDLAALVAAPRLALAATDGSLAARVRRILGEPGDARPSASGWFAALFAILLSLGFVVPAALARPEDRDLSQLAELTAAPDSAATRAEPVQAGVPAGVAGGLGGGVIGGAPGGVAVGVPGGVAAGVPSGVPESSAGADQTRDQARTEAEKKLQALVAADLQAESRFLVQQYELERQRIELERAQRESRLGNEMQEILAELDKLKTEHARAERMVGIGLATEPAVLALQTQLRQAEARLETLRRSQQSTEREMRLNLMDAEQRMERDRSRLEMLKVQRELEAQSGTLLDRTERDRERAALQAQLEALEQRFRYAMATSDRSARDAADQTRPIASGDVIGVTIEGEPDLPVIYQVSEAGTIRLPLLGTLRVSGRTTTQVRDEIARVLADRRLLSNPTVEVRIKER